jgi:hypothetical protein
LPVPKRIISDKPSVVLSEKCQLPRNSFVVPDEALVDVPAALKSSPGRR